MKYALALVIAIVVLGGVGVLLFAGAQGGWRELQQTSLYQGTEASTFYNTSESALPGFLALLTSEDNSRSKMYIAGNDQDIDVLGNDQDHDGNYDSIADPLTALGLILAISSIGFLLRPLGDDRLLLALCEPPKLSSVWLPVLERPG